MIYENVRKGLLNSVRKARISKSIIFYGYDSKEIEKIIKEFMCNISGVDNISKVDLFEFKNDRRSIGINEIREINSEILKKSLFAKERFILIHNGDKMTVEAQNAFLKSLEDTPEHIFIIISLCSMDAIIDTIRSRCLLINCLKPSLEEYGDIFRIKDIDIKNLYLSSNGSISLSNLLINKEGIYNMYIYILKVIKILFSGESLELTRQVEQINNYNNCFLEEFYYSFLSIIRDIIVFKETRDEEFIENVIFKEDIIDIANICSVYKVEYLFRLMQLFKDRVLNNLNIKNCFKIMLFKVKEA